MTVAMNIMWKTSCPDDEGTAKMQTKAWNMMKTHDLKVNTHTGKKGGGEEEAGGISGIGA